MESRPGRRRDGCLRTTHFLREKRRFQQAFQVDLPLLRLATSSEAAIHQQHIARQFSSSEEKRQGMHGRPFAHRFFWRIPLFGGEDALKKQTSCSGAAIRCAAYVPSQPGSGCPFYSSTALFGAWKAMRKERRGRLSASERTLLILRDEQRPLNGRWFWSGTG
jgi:hypothetical protein